MEGSLKLIVGILLLVVVISTGRNILAKKALGNNKKASSEAVTKTVSEEKPKEAVVPQESAPIPQPPVEKTLVMTLKDLEAESMKPMCESDWEKSFCPKLTISIMAAKGTRIMDKRLIVFVDNGFYNGLSDRFLYPSVAMDPTQPPPTARVVDSAQKNSLAGALFLKEFLTSFKGDLSDRNLIMVFLKNPTASMPINTFAYECLNQPLQMIDPSKAFTEDKLKALDIDYIDACRPL